MAAVDGGVRKPQLMAFKALDAAPLMDGAAGAKRPAVIVETARFAAALALRAGDQWPGGRPAS